MPYYQAFLRVYLVDPWLTAERLSAKAKIPDGLEHRESLPFQ
jgi:hypothetical protein